jgi:hypothetical protein
MAESEQITYFSEDIFSVDLELRFRVLHDFNQNIIDDWTFSEEMQDNFVSIYLSQNVLLYGEGFIPVYVQLEVVFEVSQLFQGLSIG